MTYGSSQSYYITPDAGYYISQILVDGTSYGPISYYEFVYVIQNHTIHAEFAINTYTLSVSVNGSGSVASDPLSGTYEHGTWVKLTAIPDLNWAFVRWTGDLTGTANQDSVRIDSDKNITANFADIAMPYKLSINIDGLGTVTRTPNQPTDTFGDWVILSATPNDDWSFDGWRSEYFNSTNNPDSLQITGNTLVTASFVFTGASGWLEKESVPMASDIKPGKYVKDGGALVAVENDLYAFHGNKSWKFFKYSGGIWDTTIANIPYGVKFKPNTTPDTMLINYKKVGCGAALVYDNDHNMIYAVKGSGTYEFWVYDISSNTWTAREFLPTARKIKGGTALAYANGLVYLLATGQKAGEHNFYAYNPASNSWAALNTAPNGMYGKAWSLGTGLASIGNYIYVIKGKDKYNPLWVYDIAQDTWYEKEPMPVLNALGKNTKIRDGGSLTTDGSLLYAIKGGGKQDFWMYAPAHDTLPGIWTALETIP